MSKTRDDEGLEGVTEASPGTGIPKAVMAILVCASILLLILGFVAADNAVTQTAFFAAAAVCGILARMMQAGIHHDIVMYELRRRG